MWMNRIVRYTLAIYVGKNSVYNRNTQEIVYNRNTQGIVLRRGHSGNGPREWESIEIIR